MELYPRAPGEARPKPIIGMGGQGGAGKTFNLISAMAYYHIIHHYHFKIDVLPPTCIVADTIPNLKDRIIAPARRDFAGMFQSMEGHKEHGRCLLFRNENLGAIWLRNAEELDSLRGKELGAIGLEEASTFAELQSGEHILDLVEYPVRTTLPVLSLPILFAFNWDGIGTPWLRRCFWPDDAKPDANGQIYRRDAKRFKYIPFDLANHPDKRFVADQYEKMQGFTGAMRESRLYGRPGVPTGALFPSFERKVHTFKFRDRFPMGLPHWYLVYIGLDWGIADPFCALWTAIDEKGDFWTFREEYGSGLMEEQQAMLIRDKTASNEQVRRVYYDPSMDHQTHKRQKTQRPVIEAFREILGNDERFHGLSHGDNASRIHNWRNLNMMMFYQGTHLPNWHIEEGCSNLIREIEGAKYKTMGGVWCADMDERLPDHALTAAAYHLQRIIGQKSINPMQLGSLYVSDVSHYTPQPGGAIDSDRKSLRI